MRPKRRTLNENPTPLDKDLLEIDAQDKKSSHVCVISTNRDNVFLFDAQLDALFGTHLTEEEFVVGQVLKIYFKATSF